MSTIEHTLPTVGMDDYHAALSGVVRYETSHSGRLRLTERDRADLLHRLSTNDIRKLQPGDGTRTVLTNHNARIVDLLTVYALPEHLLVITSPNERTAVLNLLRKNIFFTDRVVVEDLSDQTVEFHFYGPSAAAFLAELVAIDVQSWPLHHIQGVSVGSTQAWLARALPLAGDGFVLYGRVEDRQDLDAAIAQVAALSQESYEVLRVEQGYPAPGKELGLDYIPLETRLRDAISFTKGCYVGQEIIARMDSRGRLAKQLMGLRLERLVEPGGKLQHMGKEAGDLTSTVRSPRFGPIGLAYVRTAAAEPGTVVEVGEGVTAEVVELPFT